MNELATLPHCPDCGLRLWVEDTAHACGNTYRRLRCDCGQRFESQEIIIRRLPPVAISGNGRQRKGTGANGPPPAATNPPASAGGIGGTLPGVLAQPPSSDPKSESSLLGKPRARARIKPEASPHFVPMRDRFVERWEHLHGDKYLFEVRDGVALAKMIAKHPQTVERWDAMIDRYFVSVYWAERRHPLNGLANHANDFAGDTNGIPRRGDKWTDSRSAALDWMQRKAHG